MPHETATIADLVARWLPGVIPSVIRTGIHLDAYTPDGQPLIGRLPGYQDVMLAAAFCGHGFAKAPAVGAILADLATNERSDICLDPWAPDRFHGLPEEVSVREDS
jgi:sarcosine oxidase